MNRGSLGPASHPVTVLRRFNEAPIHESGKYRSQGCHLLATARFNEAPIHESGKWRPKQQWTKVLGASMRPRFMNRGSKALVGEINSTPGELQ